MVKDERGEDSTAQFIEHIPKTTTLYGRLYLAKEMVLTSSPFNTILSSQMEHKK